MPRSIPIVHARYAVRDAEWTATLRLYTEGPKLGRYVIDYWLPAPGDKRKRVRPEFRCSTQSQALRDFATYVRDIIPDNVADALRSTHTPVSDESTIADILAWYVRDVMPARGNATTTRDANTVIYDRFVAFCLKADIIYVTDLEQHQSIVDTYINALIADKKKASTIRKELTILKAAFRAAVDRGILPAPPVRTWNAPRKTETRMDMLTPEEFRKLVDRFRDIHSSFYNVVRFVAFTGCRPSDACKLRWQDVDLEKKTALMRIQKTSRLVAIPLVGEILAAVTAEQGRNAEWVFTDRHAAPLSPGLICRMVRFQSEIAIGRAVGPRLFRRNVVSLLINSGADRDHVRALTGHRSDAIAAYLHVSQSAAHGLAERLQAALKMTPSDTEA